jgi:hypothetical protein
MCTKRTLALYPAATTAIRNYSSRIAGKGFTAERRELRALSTAAVVHAAGETAGAISRRVSSWVKLAAPFTRDWVVKGVGLFLACAVGYVVARAVTVAAFWPGFLFVAIAGLIVLAVVTGVGVWWAFGTEHVHTRLKFGRAEPLAATPFSVSLSEPSRD